MPALARTVAHPPPPPPPLLLPSQAADPGRRHWQSEAAGPGGPQAASGAAVSERWRTGPAAHHVVSYWRRPSQTRSKPKEAHCTRRRKRRRGTMPRRPCAVCRAEFNCPASFRRKAPKCSGWAGATRTPANAGHCRPATRVTRRRIRRLSANDASISSLKHVYLVTGTYVMVEDYSYLRLLLPPTFIEPRPASCGGGSGSVFGKQRAATV